MQQFLEIEVVKLQRSLYAKILLLFLMFLVSSKLLAENKGSKDALATLKFKAGDEKGNEVRALKTELLVSKTEKLAIQQSKKLLKKYKGTSLEPEFMFRLAELYMRQSKTARFFEMQKGQKGMVQFLPPSAKKASSKKTIRKAIAIYDKVERKFPKYRDVDLVVFNHAFARQQLGHIKTAERLYNRVIRRYAKSSLVPDCHLAIGEMAFSQKRFQSALKHFNSIKKYPNSRVYPYGVYKAAWTKYNLHDGTGAIRELEEVVRYGRYVSKNNIDARLDLRREALVDMTVFFEDIYPSSEALKYFTLQAGELPVEPVLMKMAGLYKRHSRFKDQHRVLEDFLKTFTKSEYLPEAMVESVFNYESLKKRPRTVAQIKNFYEVCESKNYLNLQKGTEVERAQKEKECWHKYKDTSHFLAQKWLKRWKKYNLTQFAGYAESGFKLYLKRAESNKKDRTTRYILSELLFKRKKFAEASEQYERVSASKVDPMAHDAAYAAAVSLEKSVNSKWKESSEKRFDSLVKSYVKRFPKGKHRLELEFNLGLIHYEKERYDIAGVHFKKIGELYPNHNKGQKAQDLYLDILNLKKNYGELKSYTSFLLKKHKDGKRKAKLLALHRQSYFFEIQNMEKSSDKILAAKEYKIFALKNKGSHLAPKAWWNAVQIQYKLGLLLKATNDSLAYTKHFPKDSKKKEALIEAAKNFETMNKLEKAAEVLLVLSKTKDKRQESWMLLAANFYRILGQKKKALKTYRSLLASKNIKVKAEALFSVNEYDKSVDKKRFYKGLAQLVDLGVAPYSYESKFILTQKAFLENKYAKAFQMAASLVSKKSKASKKVRAQSRLIQAQILDREMRMQSMKSKVERVALVIALKTEKLEKAQRAFQAVVRYGDAETSIQSLKKLAQSYAHYIKSLKEMPTPKGLPENQINLFKSELTNLILPMEDKEVETIHQALQIAKAMELRSGHIPELQKKLDSLNMVKTKSVDVAMTELDIVVPAFREGVK